jgi:hypothetical protein
LLVAVVELELDLVEVEQEGIELLVMDLLHYRDQQKV